MVTWFQVAPVDAQATGAGGVRRTANLAGPAFLPPMPWYTCRMSRLAQIVAAVLLTTACTVPSVVPAASWLDAARVTIKLLAGDGGGGSGFPIDVIDLGDGTQSVLILTAAHVAEGGMSGWSALIADERFLGYPTFVAQHPTMDAALVRVTVRDGGPRVRAVPLRLAEAEVGEHVWAIGYPGAQRRAITDGYVGQHGCASAPVFPGNSGGPLVDDHGRAVGIVVRMGLFNVYGPTLVPQDMIFLPVTDILPWLEPWIR